MVVGVFDGVYDYVYCGGFVYFDMFDVGFFELCCVVFEVVLGGVGM